MAKTSQYWNTKSKTRRKRKKKDKSVLERIVTKKQAERIVKAQINPKSPTVYCPPFFVYRIPRTRGRPRKYGVIRLVKKK